MSKFRWKERVPKPNLSELWTLPVLCRNPPIRGWRAVISRQEMKIPMNRLILADNQAIFRAGAARVLALEDDMRIAAQCEDGEKLFAAIDALRGSVLLVSSSLRLDLKDLLARVRSAGSRIVLVAEN